MKKTMTGTLCAALFLLLFLFSSCTVDYTREDIIQYVKATLNLSHFSVSKTYEPREEEDGYTDRIWTVKNKKTGVVFHVIDDYHWGMETLTNSLSHDYDEAVLHFLRPNLSNLRFLDLRLSTDEQCYEAKIIGRFRNERELKSCYDSLTQLQQTFYRAGYPDLSIQYQLVYLHPLRTATEQTIRDGDSFGQTNESIDYQKIFNKYLLTALDYRYIGTYETFTGEQIFYAIGSEPNRLGIYRSDDAASPEYYKTIVAHTYEGISFGSLFEVLKLEGFEPEGNANHYSFTGFDGCRYEFSYSFTEAYQNEWDKEGVGFYYYKDEEKVRLNSFWDTHISLDTVREMTGLHLIEEIRASQAENE